MCGWAAMYVAFTSAHPKFHKVLSTADYSLHCTRTSERLWTATVHIDLKKEKDNQGKYFQYCTVRWWYTFAPTPEFFFCEFKFCRTATSLWQTTYTGTGYMLDKAIEIFMDKFCQTLPKWICRVLLPWDISDYVPRPTVFITVMCILNDTS